MRRGQRGLVSAEEDSTASHHPRSLLGFSTYDSACQIAQEIAEKIQQRNQYERRGEKTSKLTVTIRALLQNLKEKITLLKDLLLRAVSTHQMYPRKHFQLYSRMGGKAILF
uniref:Syntaxin-8-like isoform X1 n=1 Tax=Castor canadensis TaxID=51338 RepID=A0A8B7UCT5_CASCN|nr:syntaxin-8-like isoform X1 [Castor canadensis]